VRTWLIFTTDFGDAAVLLPTATAILLWMSFAANQLRFAKWWIVSVGFCIGTTAVLKIFFYGCPPASDMRSPSGHTGFSVLVYGTIALVTAVQYRGLRRALAIATGGILILSVAASRLLLEVHSLPEVGTGLMVGMASLILFGRVYLQSPHLQVWPLIILSAILISILHGYELHVEGFLHRFTGYLSIRCS
jgi:membrane-associated phospholipid phosphatase